MLIIVSFFFISIKMEGDKKRVRENVGEKREGRELYFFYFIIRDMLALSTTIWWYSSSLGSERF